VGSPWTIGAFIVAAAFLTAWVRAELRTRHPLINLWGPPERGSAAGQRPGSRTGGAVGWKFQRQPRRAPPLHRIPLTTLLPVEAGIMTAAGMLLSLAHTELGEILVGMLVFGLRMRASYVAMPALIARSVAAAELGSSVSFNQVLRTVEAHSALRSQGRCSPRMWRRIFTRPVPESARRSRSAHSSAR
jgi:hypothetical protein